MVLISLSLSGVKSLEFFSITTTYALPAVCSTSATRLCSRRTLVGTSDSERKMRYLLLHLVRIRSTQICFFEKKTTSENSGEKTTTFQEKKNLKQRNSSLFLLLLPFPQGTLHYFLEFAQQV